MSFETRAAGRGGRRESACAHLRKAAWQIGSLLLLTHALSSHAAYLPNDLDILTQPSLAQPYADAANIGDSIDLNTGSLSIRQVDVRLPGNGPTIEIARVYQPGLYPYGTLYPLAGDWQLDVPLITGTVAHKTGWFDSRCSQFRLPDPDRTRCHAATWPRRTERSSLYQCVTFSAVKRTRAPSAGSSPRACT